MILTYNTEQENKKKLLKVQIEEHIKLFKNNRVLIPSISEKYNID